MVKKKPMCDSGLTGLIDPRLWEKCWISHIDSLYVKWKLFSRPVSFLSSQPESDIGRGRVWREHSLIHARLCCSDGHKKLLNVSSDLWALQSSSYWPGRHMLCIVLYCLMLCNPLSDKDVYQLQTHSVSNLATTMTNCCDRDTDTVL